jgi:hypothetical protein
MRRRGFHVHVPILSDSLDSTKPYWKQHAESVAQALADIPKDVPLVLVAHSGAGPLLPAVRQMLSNPVHACVFVDAGIPRNGATRLDLMKSEDAEWADGFRQELERGERFPTWSMDDLQEVIPDPELRRQMLVELQPRGFDFFSEPIPVFDGWPDAPCIYIQFSESYEWDAFQARQVGWPFYKMQGDHFHMLVKPSDVTELMVNAVNNLP